MRLFWTIFVGLLGLARPPAVRDRRRALSQGGALPLCYDAAMDIEYAVLADYVDIVNSKLYLMGGGWDITTVAETPVGLRLGVALGVRLGWNETDQPAPVTIIVENDDGQEYLRVEGTLQVSRPEGLPPGATQLSQIAANLALTVPVAGGYRVRLRVLLGEVTVEQHLPFRVVIAS